jgi:hypothetical protein
MFPAYIEKVMEERMQKRLNVKMQKKELEKQVSHICNCFLKKPGFCFQAEFFIKVGKHLEQWFSN